MRKARFLVGVLVLALMLMGAGYAALYDNFDNQLAVDLSVLDFNVRVISETETEPLDEDFMEVRNNFDLTSQDMGDLVQVELINIYPGCTYEYEVEIESRSSMGAYAKVYGGTNWNPDNDNPQIVHLFRTFYLMDENDVYQEVPQDVFESHMFAPEEKAKIAYKVEFLLNSDIFYRDSSERDTQNGIFEYKITDEFKFYQFNDTVSTL